MQGAHLHLLVNHIPILGFFLSFIFVSAAIFGRDANRWMPGALVIIALAFLGGLVAFVTGTPALEAINDLPRTSGRALTQHHVGAVVAAVLATVATSVACIVAALGRKRGAYSRRWLLALLAVNGAAAVALAWTGLAGGRINHPEIQGPADREGGRAHPH
jgi:hypothetical protein